MTRNRRCLDRGNSGASGVSGALQKEGMASAFESWFSPHVRLLPDYSGIGIGVLAAAVVGTAQQDCGRRIAFLNESVEGETMACFFRELHVRLGARQREQFEFVGVDGMENPEIPTPPIRTKCT